MQVVLRVGLGPGSTFAANVVCPECRRERRQPVVTIEVDERVALAAADELKRAV